jgi:hypothetical protein
MGYPRRPDGEQGPSVINTAVASVYVDDQDKALTFYTDGLGFVWIKTFRSGPDG